MKQFHAEHVSGWRKATQIPLRANPIQPPAVPIPDDSTPAGPYQREWPSQKARVGSQNAMQQELFAPVPPAVHSATSVAAAVAIKPTANKLRKKVFEFIDAKRNEGATDEEIQIGLTMSGNTERPRRRELEKAGAIIRSTGVRLNKSGRLAAVFLATARCHKLELARTGILF